MRMTLSFNPRRSNFVISRLKGAGAFFLAAALAAAALFPGLTAAAAGYTFDDVYAADWYAGDVRYVYLCDIMNGTGSGFSPDATTTRAQMVTVLHRLGGSPEAKAPSGFSDVSASAWYAGAVAWAAENGIAEGYGGGSFGPDDPITRAQFAVFLHRFASFLGLDTSKQADLSGYSDRGEIASYAAVPLAWANAAGLINGLGGGKLSPNGSATRAQAAAILHRFAEGLLGVSAEGSGKSFVLAERPGESEKPGKSEKPDEPETAVESVKHQNRSFETSSGTVTADVLTVDMKDPRVRVVPLTTGSTMGTRAQLSNIVKWAGEPMALFTANFMDSGVPVGHFMRDGELYFTGSNNPTLGLRPDGSMLYGKPEINARIVPEAGDAPPWIAAGVNTPGTWFASTLYTPRKGGSFTAPTGGVTITVSGGRVSACETVEADEEVSIPAGGYVLFMMDSYISGAGGSYRAPAVGEAVRLEYFLPEPDSEGFLLDGVTQIVAGGPRLVKDGSLYTWLESHYSEPLFNVTGRTARICVGSTADGKLISACIDDATIQDAREIMLALGCVNAINLDGGGSAAMYFNGTFLRDTTRPLAYTIAVYYD